MENQKEEFKTIEGFDGFYEISNLGRVKSLKCNREKILKPTDKGSGYMQVSLYLGRKLTPIKIHFLVAQYFLNHTKRSSKIVIDHINNIKSDNRVDNLQIISQRENNSKDKKGYSSEYIGVSWNKQANKWHSQIVIKGKVKYLGLFTNELDAHYAYQKTLNEIS